MFKATTGTNYDGLNIPSLPPGIYNDYKLTDIKKDRTTPSGGGEGTLILTFTFDGKEGPFQHTEYDIKADDAKAADKAANMVKRVGHILRQFNIPQATLDSMPEHANFDAYCNWIMATIGQSYVGVPLMMKVIGSVYEGKARTSFPGYIPFLASGNAGTKSLSFSANEKLGNDQWSKHQNSTPDTESPSGGSPGTESRATDF